MMLGLLRKIIPLSTRRQIGELYIRYSEPLCLDQALAPLERRLRRFPMNRPFDCFEIQGEPVGICLLIATSHQGILLYDAGRIRQLIGDGNFYGISKRADTWYAFQKLGLHGRIVSFELNGNRLENLRTRIWGLPHGVHQIDFIDGVLYVIDAHNNRILLYDDVESRACTSWRECSRSVFPNGQLRQGRTGDNYNHFNSVFRRGDRIYLVAHNATSKTGRRSELYVLDLDMNVQEVLPIQGGNCHNYYADGNRTLICRSLEGTVEDGGREVLAPGTFTRGVSVGTDYLVFGGSEMELHRERRGGTNSYIYVTDLQYSPQCTIVLHSTQVHEVRRVGAADYSLSEVAYAAAMRKAPLRDRQRAQRGQEEDASLES